MNEDQLLDVVTDGITQQEILEKLNTNSIDEVRETIASLVDKGFLKVAVSHDYSNLLYYKTGIKKQVGGDHYKKYPIQPWLFCVKNEIPYTEACIIKYLVRWRDKNGLEDLQKAQHLLEMLINYNNTIEQ